LTGFWALIVPELADVQKACEQVEKHRRNHGRLSITASPRKSIEQSPAKSQIPAPRQTPSTVGSQVNRRASRSTPGLRKFLAGKRRENAQVLGDHNF
jgi:hypothetical protein